MNDSEILEKVENLIPNPKQRKMKVLQNKSEELHSIIMKRTEFLDEDANLQKRLTFIKNNLFNLPNCKICENQHSRADSNYCSRECYYKDSEVLKNKLKNVDQQAKTNKQKKTLKEKYGYEFNSQRPEVKEKLSKSKLIKDNPDALALLQNYEWLNHNYKILKRSPQEIAKELNVYYGTVLDYIDNHHKINREIFTNQSGIENEISFLIQKENIKVEQGNQSILSGRKELDLYMCDYNIAIEVNGLYWHSFTNQSKANMLKHLNKTTECLEKNIQLIQITNEKWNEKQDIVMSMIFNKLGLSKKIYARETSVEEIGFKEYQDFCVSNHINGYSNAKIRIALKKDNEIFSVMSFSKPRYNKTYEYELIRLATKKGYCVVGGASKLFQFFIKKYNPSSIISYADRQYGEGNVYHYLSFIKERSTLPGYHWTDGNNTFNRVNFQKHKLKNKLEIYDPNISEFKNMVNNGYKAYYDCGHNVWIWRNKKEAG